MATSQLAAVFTWCCLAASAAPALDGQRPAGSSRTYAQQLVDRLVSRHEDVEGVELSVVSESGCAAIAGTDPGDVGHRCAEHENEPMRTGEPLIEEPTAADPVFNITQALHDATGRLIGAVAFGIAPGPGRNRAAMVARARALLRELESAIPSKEKLFETASPR